MCTYICSMCTYMLCIHTCYIYVAYIHKIEYEQVEKKKEGNIMIKLTKEGKQKRKRKKEECVRNTKMLITNELKLEGKNE